jgi:8-oxo-dGTP pyrophosphatase MutT (NUDIX family)
MSSFLGEKIYFGASEEELVGKTPVRKSRAVIHDENGVMLLQNIGGVLTLPGGARETGDKDDLATALREAGEEYGLMALDDAEIEPICTVSNYQNPYLNHRGEEVEKYTETMYFSVLTDLSLRGAVSLTADETDGELETIEIYEDYVRAVIEDHSAITDNPRWPFYERGLLAAMDRYFAMKSAKILR